MPRMPGAGQALKTAVFGLIAFIMLEIGALLMMPAVWYAFHGDMGAVALAPVGGIALYLGVISLREVAGGMRGA